MIVTKLGCFKGRCTLVTAEHAFMARGSFGSSLHELFSSMSPSERDLLGLSRECRQGSREERDRDRLYSLLNSLQNWRLQTWESTSPYRWQSHQLLFALHRFCRYICVSAGGLRYRLLSLCAGNAHMF